VRSWLFGGNTVVRVGVVVLLFGVAFLLNYAADQGWFPIELRLTGAALAGLGLVAVGVVLRDRRREYALTLQGGGVGIVYLTAFAAVNVYDLIGAGVGLAVMVVLVVIGAVLAVTQDARSLAVLASLGGFLGPVLVSRDASHVALFGCLHRSLLIRQPVSKPTASSASTARLRHIPCASRSRTRARRL
jgi:uncharacterized membrane protein